jgi:hypothetical protein
MYLDQFIEYLFQAFESAKNDWIIKETLITCLEQIVYLIEEFPDLQQAVEKLFKAYVLPEFQNQNPMIQASVCSGYGALIGNISIEKEHVEIALKGIFGSFYSDHLPL